MMNTQHAPTKSKGYFVIENQISHAGLVYDIQIRLRFGMANLNDKYLRLKIKSNAKQILNPLLNSPNLSLKYI